MTCVTPWQVRYLRWWYERQVAWHAEMARRGRHREYNLMVAEREAKVIPNIRRHWLETGRVPDVYTDQQTALERMRVPPRISMLKKYDRWISPPPPIEHTRLARHQRSNPWMHRRGPRGKGKR